MQWRKGYLLLGGISRVRRVWCSPKTSRWIMCGPLDMVAKQLGCVARTDVVRWPQS